MKIPGITAERLNAIFAKKSSLYQTTETFDIKAIVNKTKQENRFAFIASKKKLSKLAVIRNRADRRLKAAVQSEYPNLKLKGKSYSLHRLILILSGYDFLFFLKPPIITAPWSTVVQETAKSLRDLEKKTLKKKSK
ncbi:uncharacterized protein B0P05DRAFT_591646 [Gilbertella persicaria]|uniref:uncharacterized protein n=1 Tax=Gilbertella persicaria TaxID=101096 RepID=UPI0022204E82|nr:uncharacterized protein B0P05DRAFT_591646 [Gilbertella persicaria]KAI8053693.1 hypothetical protein B0P05DRAFT_591646 [Gilbertella persicaria]